MAQGANLGSCEMCAWERRYTRATQEITYGAGRYAVCEHHANHPIMPKAEIGSAPSNGTETSQEAAKQSESKVTPQAYLILGVIAASPEGLTREEIYRKAGVTNQAACARLKLLQDLGLVLTEGERFVPSTRRKQQVYFLARRAA